MFPDINASPHCGCNCRQVSGTTLSKSQVKRSTQTKERDKKKRKRKGEKYCHRYVRPKTG